MLCLLLLRVPVCGILEDLDSFRDVTVQYCIGGHSGPERTLSVSVPLQVVWGAARHELHRAFSYSELLTIKLVFIQRPLIVKPIETSAFLAWRYFGKKGSNLL